MALVNIGAGFNSTVQVRDHKFQTCLMGIANDVSLVSITIADRAAFVKAIVDEYSYAGVIKATSSVYNAYEGEIADPGQAGFDKVDHKAVLIFRENATGRTRRLSIPAPKVTMFDDLPYVGLRVKKTIGDAIAVLFQQASGGQVTFIEGWFSSDTNKNDR